MREWRTETIELASGVFAYVQAGGGFCVANAGIIASADGTTVIDALFTPPMTLALLQAAARVSPAPVRRLISTHHHVDHTLGNANFPEDTRILAHARAKAEMERVGRGVLDVIRRMAPHFTSDLREARIRMPDETFDEPSLEIDAGGRTLRLLHMGTGHTRGDVLALLPEQRVLFAGDLAFFYVTPLAFEGHIGNWIALGERVLAMDDYDVIVPGHGPVGGKDDLREMLGYLQLVRDHARRAFDGGASQEEAARSIDLGEYGEWGESERVSFNVARLYQEFRGELDGWL